MDVHACKHIKSYPIRIRINYKKSSWIWNTNSLSFFLTIWFDWKKYFPLRWWPVYGSNAFSRTVGIMMPCRVCWKQAGEQWFLKPGWVSPYNSQWAATRLQRCWVATMPRGRRLSLWAVAKVIPRKLPTRLLCPTRRSEARWSAWSRVAFFFRLRGSENAPLSDETAIRWTRGLSSRLSLNSITATAGKYPGERWENTPQRKCRKCSL